MERRWYRRRWGALCIRSPERTSASSYVYDEKGTSASPESLTSIMRKHRNRAVHLGWDRIKKWRVNKRKETSLYKKHHTATYNWHDPPFGMTTVRSIYQAFFFIITWNSTRSTYELMRWFMFLFIIHALSNFKAFYFFFFCNNSYPVIFLVV